MGIQLHIKTVQNILNINYKWRKAWSKYINCSLNNINSRILCGKCRWRKLNYIKINWGWQFLNIFCIMFFTVVRNANYVFTFLIKIVSWIHCLWQTDPFVYFFPTSTKYQLSMSIIYVSSSQRLNILNMVTPKTKLTFVSKYKRSSNLNNHGRLNSLIL